MRREWSIKTRANTHCRQLGECLLVGLLHQRAAVVLISVRFVSQVLIRCNNVLYLRAAPEDEGGEAMATDV